MKTKLLAANFKTLSFNELSKITGGELPPFPTPGGGGGCRGGLSSSPILGGSGGPSSSTGDSAGTAMDVIGGSVSGTGSGTITNVPPPLTMPIRCNAN